LLLLYNGASRVAKMEALTRCTGPQKGEQHNISNSGGISKPQQQTQQQQQPQQPQQQQQQQQETTVKEIRRPAIGVSKWPTQVSFTTIRN